jgi:hypothetical protein
MKKLWSVLRLALPALLLSCIDFDAQTLTYRYDPSNDRLLLFQEYRGIHATGETLRSSDANIEEARAESGSQNPPHKVPTDEEASQLSSLSEGQQTFFFDNWIFQYERAQCEESLREDRLALGQASTTEKELLELRIALCQHLLDSVKITNGPFYLDEGKRLCAHQFVVVSRVSRLVSLVNRYISAYVLADELEDYSEAERQRLRSFARTGSWVAIDGQQIRIHFFLTYKEFLEFRGDFLTQFTASEIIYNYTEPMVELILGRPGNEKTELRATPAQTHPANLNEYVSKTYGLKPKPDLGKVRDAFLRTGKAGK